jgi:enoyl-CoA hydratase/carnithine racemase
MRRPGCGGGRAPPVNALDLELLDAIVATMGHLAGPVVVTGAGKCFSAGVDLRAIVDGGSEYTDRFITSLSSTTPRRWLLRSTGMPLRAAACWPWPRTCA